MSTTTTNPPFGAQLIGRTEKSLNAILGRILLDSGLSEPEYVAMRVCSDHAGANRSDVEARLSGVFRKGPDHAGQLLDRLTSAGIIESDEADSLTLTSAGVALRDGLAQRTNAITERLWGDLPDQDLVVAARVLSTVLTRAANEHA